MRDAKRVQALGRLEIGLEGVPFTRTVSVITKRTEGHVIFLAESMFCPSFRHDSDAHVSGQRQGRRTRNN